MPPVRVLRPLFVLSLACALAAGVARAQSGQPDIHGDVFGYDDTTKDAIVTGNARMTLGDLLLTADEIRYNSATQIAAARGHLIITSGARRLVADEGTYHTPDGQITARNLRVGQFPVYVSGETVAGMIVWLPQIGCDHCFCNNCLRHTGDSGLCCVRDTR